jgi:transcriptional regulator with XRE-family HTH domain
MSRITAMTLQSDKDLEDYGLARVRDVAFDAVHKLWRRRRASGVSQKDLAHKLGRDPGWVSRQLSGPGNWTFRSFGALIEALGGEVEIIVHAIEDPLEGSNGFDAYKRTAEAPNEYMRRLINVPKVGDKGPPTKHHRSIKPDLHSHLQGEKRLFSSQLEDVRHG